MVLRHDGDGRGGGGPHAFDGGLDLLVGRVGPLAVVHGLPQSSERVFEHGSPAAVLRHLPARTVRRRHGLRHPHQNNRMPRED